jgi:hydrogenase/urease accessory protein HupE
MNLVRSLVRSLARVTLVLAGASLLVVCAFARDARGHELGLSRGTYTIHESTVTATLVFAAREAMSVRDDAVANGLVVGSDAGPCPARVVSRAPVEEDGLRIVLEAVCPAPPPRVSIEALFLGQLPFGHRHLVEAGDVRTTLTVGKRSFVFARGGATEGRAGILLLGVEHVVRGIDHLLFVVALALSARSARPLILAITAFTIGHSISLACATFGLFAPSSRWVEPVIALSIAWAAGQNLRTSTAGPERGRWPITLGFGVVHGFGLATGLRELFVGRAELPLALALFNAGVEIGQLVALVVVVPALILIRRSVHGERVVTTLNGALVLTGVLWFVARIVSP